MDNKTIGVRFDIKVATLLKDVSKARGEQISDFIRRAVRKELASLSFLTDMEKKALGVKKIRRK